MDLLERTLAADFRAPLRERVDRSEHAIDRAARERIANGHDLAEVLRLSTCGRLDCARRAVTSRWRIPLCGRCAAEIDDDNPEEHR